MISTAGVDGLRDEIQSEVNHNPIRTVLIAAGVGYVLGGGLAAPLTRRLTRLALRALLIPLLDGPTARLWDWIRSDVGSPAASNRIYANETERTLGKPQS